VGERVRSALTLLQLPGVKASVVRRCGVGAWPVVGPGDGVTDVDGDAARRELEVSDRDRWVSRRVSANRVSDAWRSGCAPRVPSLAVGRKPHLRGVRLGCRGGRPEAVLWCRMGPAGARLRRCRMGPAGARLRRCRTGLAGRGLRRCRIGPAGARLRRCRTGSAGRGLRCRVSVPGGGLRCRTGRPGGRRRGGDDGETD
jgi:hypothetical protein